MLKLIDVHVHFGKLHILQGVSLEVQAGESVALLGRNGVGKTTTLRAIMGLAARGRGTIEFEGHDLGRCEAHQVPRKGIGYVPQGRGIFPNLSVYENLCIGLPGKSDAEREEYVFARFPRLKERLTQAGGTLSGGEQQMLAMGRALMARPRLLLLDEPSMGLAPLMVDQIYAQIARIAAAGTPILLIEQNAHLALQVSQRGYVMESGLIAFNGASADLAHDVRVRTAYLGETSAA